LTKNDIYYRRWIRLIGAFSTFIALIGFFPVIGNISTILYYNDIYINPDKYQKKCIVLDSLTYLNTDGNDNPRVDGYSKDLDNYKTIILLSKARNEESKIDSLGNTHIYVWHRKGIDFAYPARKEEKTIPYKQIFYQKAKIPFFWLLAVIITFIMFKITTRSRLFKGFDH
jgi:hypothetical protein